MASDPATPARRVLVVGATGILRPAALGLVAAGDTVVAVARGRARLTALAAEAGRRVQVAAMDVTCADAPTGPTGPGGALAAPLDAAVVYQPQPPAGGFEQLLARVTGTVVRVLTSQAAEPHDNEDPEPLSWPWSQSPRRAREVRLLLGWTGPGDAPRWHSPQEISSAALAVLDRGDDAVLGRVRPWADRP